MLPPSRMRGAAKRAISKLVQNFECSTCRIVSSGVCRKPPAMVSPIIETRWSNSGKAVTNFSRAAWSWASPTTPWAVAAER